MIISQEQPNMAKVATIQFGSGIVEMLSGVRILGDDAIGVLILDTSKPQPIGVVSSIKNATICPSDHEVVMTFESVESLEVLITTLQSIKAGMDSNNVSNR